MSSISIGLAKLNEKKAQQEPNGESSKPKPEAFKDIIQIEPIAVTPIRKNEKTITLNIKFRVKVDKKALNSVQSSKIPEKGSLNADIIINDVLNKAKKSSLQDKKCPRHVKFEGSPSLKPESPVKCEKNKDAELDRLIGLMADLLNTKKCFTSKPETIKNSETNSSSDLIKKDEIIKNNQINTESECEKKCISEIAQEKKEEPAQIVDPLLNGAEKNVHKNKLTTNETPVEEKEPTLNVEPLKEDEADVKKQTETTKLFQCNSENVVKIEDEYKETLFENKVEKHCDKTAENKECCVTYGKVLLETWI